MTAILDTDKVDDQAGDKESRQEDLKPRRSGKLFTFQLTLSDWVQIRSS